MYMYIPASPLTALLLVPPVTLVEPVTGAILNIRPFGTVRLRGFGCAGVQRRYLGAPRALT